MGSLADFIPSYPHPTELRYEELMCTKKEFQDLVHDIGVNPSIPSVDDSFFYDYQMLVGRWWAPWTNNRIGFIRWDPGTGKTRAELIIAMMWMRHSGFKNSLTISASNIILRAIEDEVVRYNKHEEVLASRTYKSKGRAHGRTISKSRYVSKKGFKRWSIIKFINGIHTAYRASGMDSLRDYIRSKYKNHSIFVDEAHLLRASSGGKIKKSYEGIMEILDALRDICPIFIMTATPVVNTWKDLFSILGMLHPPDVRQEMEREVDAMETYVQTFEEKQEIQRLVNKYSKMMVSDMTSLGIVPSKEALPGPWCFQDGQHILFTVYNEMASGETQTLIKENVFPIFMSDYQTQYTSILEHGEDSITGMTGTAAEVLGKLSANNKLYLNVRLAYNFALPIIEGESDLDSDAYVIKDKTSKTYIPNDAKAIIRYEDDTEENIFKIEWEIPGEDDPRLIRWNNTLMAIYAEKGIEPGDTAYKIFRANDPDSVMFPSMDRGLGRYSVKDAYAIWMLTYHPLVKDSPGYIQDLWVKIGTKFFAAALNVNGWRQYPGVEILTGPLYENGKLIRRFAVIDGSSDVRDTNITKIVEAYRLDANRDGMVLHFVLASRKGGISISLSNGKWVINKTPDFNKTTSIQGRDRVFRADALRYMEELGLPREIFTANLLALPSVPNDPGYDDIRQEYENDISSGNIFNKNYVEVPTDAGSYMVNPMTIEARMFQLAEVKYETAEVALDALANASIESAIRFYKANDPTVDVSTNALLYTSKTRAKTQLDIASILSSAWTISIDSSMNTMKVVADMLSNHTLVRTRYGFPRNVITYGSTLSVSSGNDPYLSAIYDTSFFSVDDVPDTKVMLERALELMTNIDGRRLTVYELWKEFLSLSHRDTRATLLELCLAIPYGAMTAEQEIIYKRIRPTIMDIYDLFWGIEEGRTMHILWYAIRSGAHLSRIGINPVPKGKTRILMPSMGAWLYSTSRESIYLSSFASRISSAEEAVRAKAKDGWYFHFCLDDGILRIREIVPMGVKKVPKLHTMDLDMPIVQSICSKITSIPLEDIRGPNRIKIENDIFRKIRDMGILIVR